MVKTKPVYYQKDGTEVLLEKTINLKENTWTTKEGVNIIAIRGLLELARKEGIVEKNFKTSITPTEGNKQQHVVNIWLGYKGDVEDDDWVRGSGEASELNTGKIQKNNAGALVYMERGLVDSSYRYAMAEKRAFSRAIIKLIGLVGVYSDVEAADFAKPQVAGSEDYSGL